MKYFSFSSKQALAGKLDAEKEGIVVPLTLEDYCIKPKIKPSNQEMAVSEKFAKKTLCPNGIGDKIVFSSIWPISMMKTTI